MVQRLIEGSLDGQANKQRREIVEAAIKFTAFEDETDEGERKMADGLVKLAVEMEVGK